MGGRVLGVLQYLSQGWQHNDASSRMFCVGLMADRQNEGASCDG